MGYGSRALELLKQYYEHRIPSLSEDSEEKEAKTISEDVSQQQGLILDNVAAIISIVFIYNLCILSMFRNKLWPKKKETFTML